MGTVTSITSARDRDPLAFRKLLTPAEVARLFGVNDRLPARWADKGWLSFVRTPGGHRRYFEDEVSAIRNGGRR